MFEPQILSSEPEPPNFNNHGNVEKDASTRVATLVARVEYRRADNAAEREACARLRYQAYLREGSIPANSAETFIDPYDETDNAYLFGLYVDGELASSLRLHIASKAQPASPSLEVFPEYLRPELDAGKVLVDPTRFVANERLSRMHPGLPYATVRLCLLAGDHFGADQLLAAVKMEHRAFYQRAFNYRMVCAPRPYPHLAQPVCLMTLHFPSSAERLYQRYPFFRSDPAERQKLFGYRHAPIATGAAEGVPQAARLR